MTLPLPMNRSARWLALGVAAYIAFAPTALQAEDLPHDRGVYTVQYAGPRRQKLEEISDLVGIPEREIYACNPSLRRKKRLAAGEKVRVAAVYRVKKGDSLGKIAQESGASLSEVLLYNPQVPDHDRIYPGQILYTPCARQSASASETKEHREVDTVRPKKKKGSKSRKTVRFPSGLELKMITDPNLVGGPFCDRYNGRSVQGRHLIHQRCEFYDPNQAGVALLEVPRADLGKRISEHFTLAEFAIIRDARWANSRYIQTWNGDQYTQYLRLDPEIIKKLEELRKKIKQPLAINSGYRSFGYNNDLYWLGYRKRPTKSRHTSGDAVDVALPYRVIARDAERVFKNGGIGKGRSFTHVDTRGRKARWRY